MIRKWLKINTRFAEILKNSVVAKNQEKICSFEGPSRLSYYTLQQTIPTRKTSYDTPCRARTIHGLSGTKLTAEDHQQSDSDESYTAVVETPARTELFEVKGPQGAAFLIEVQASDLEEVKTALTDLKGGNFYFDKSILEWFTLKCILAGELESSGDDGERLAKIHAISTGSEEVYQGSGKYFFVNSVERTMRAKRILEKLGYKISGILYRFQAKEKVSLDDDVREICLRFVQAVERLPKVVSITHNL